MITKGRGKCIGTGKRITPTPKVHHAITRQLRCYTESIQGMPLSSEAVFYTSMHNCTFRRHMMLKRQPPGVWTRKRTVHTRTKTEIETQPQHMRDTGKISADHRQNRTDTPPNSKTKYKHQENTTGAPLDTTENMTERPPKHDRDTTKMNEIPPKHDPVNT